MKGLSLVESVLLSLASGTALAGIGDFQVVPEPGVLELLALGAIVAAVVGIRKRRK